MFDNFVNDLIHYLPLAYAYHKIILDDNGTPVDYVFLDANPAFELFTGLKVKDVIGKGITEVMPEIGSTISDWIQRYGKVAMDGRTDHFSQYDEFLERWYTVTAYSPKKGHFITMFQDISGTMEIIDTLKQQRLELREKAGEIDTIFNNTSDALFLANYTNGEFRYIRNNKTHQLYTGLSTEDIKGKTPVEVMGEEVGALLNEGYERCIRERKNVIFEEVTEFHMGPRDWLVSLTPVINEGEIKYIVGSRSDMTEMKQLQRERESLLERFRAIFYEHSAMKVLLDPGTGDIVDANPALCSFFGYSREEILSMKIIEFADGFEDFIEEALQPKHLEASRGYISKQRLKNGEERFVELYATTIKVRNKPFLSIILIDVTDSVKFQDDLSRERNFLHTTLESIGDGVVTTNNDGIITSLNKAGREITGWSVDDTIGLPFSSVFKIIDEETGETLEETFEFIPTDGDDGNKSGSAILINKKKERLNLSYVVAPSISSDDSIIGAVMVFKDTTKEKRHAEQILYLSFHDALTGLHNRRFLEDQMPLLNRDEYLPLSVIVADVNGLKVTNDAFGHEAGDGLLTAVAGAIMQNCGDKCYCARWGGDEFLLILPNTPQEGLDAFLSELRGRFALLSSNSLPVSVALGSSIKENPEDSLNNAIRIAEERMYHTKLMDGKQYRRNIINALMTNLYDISNESAGHGERVKEISLLMGKALGLSKESLEELSLFSVYHDIGMVVVEKSILNKTTALNRDDWEEIKRHPVAGYRIAQNTHELSSVADYILAHHERWDGTGYPQGLSRTEIPLLARILAVPDAFDSMISDRVYRGAMSPEEAVQEIIANKGAQFDPEMVDLFVSVLLHSKKKS